ncbi:hypothetical protein ACS8E6_10795 [Salinicola halophyticus]|uniref:hypothetical protein n=1 Tax=Salinicola halophyticus TaxID=1808881 RepID=UPI003F481CD3
MFRGEQEEPAASQSVAVLYRVLDQSTLGGLTGAGALERLHHLLDNEPGETRIARDWVMGRFEDRTLRTAFIACLEQHGVRWIDAGDSAARCGTHHVANDAAHRDNSTAGRFVPDAKLLGFLDAHADRAFEWLMIWPWDCALPAVAERDLLLDLAQSSHDGLHLSLLRRSVAGAAGSQEPDFAWSGMMLPVLPRRLGDETLVSVMTDTSVAGHRAGWALESTSVAHLHSPSDVHSAEIGRAETSSFHFGICLRAKACSQNWALTCQNLERTLENLARQRSRDFRVWIAVHERPEIRTFGLDVEYVVVDFEPPVRADGTFGNDKRRKRNAIGEALKAQARNGFYYMQLDADDLLDPSLVLAVTSDDNRRGYLIENGYIFDYEKRAVARCSEETVPFWHQCGSSAVLFFEPDDFNRDGEDESYFERQRMHEQFAALAQIKGKPLTSWVDDMALYLVNHGENQWSNYRHENDGRANSKSKFVHRYKLESPAALDIFALRYPELDRREVAVDGTDREVRTS